MAARKAKYRGAHDRERKRWKLLIEAGGVPCSRGCGRLILSGQAFDLDHSDDDSGEYLGVSHSSCNRGAGARRGATLRRAAQNGNANGNAYSAREIAAIRKRHREDVERWYSRDW